MFQKTILLLQIILPSTIVLAQDEVCEANLTACLGEAEQCGQQLAAYQNLSAAHFTLVRFYEEIISLNNDHPAVTSIGSTEGPTTAVTCETFSLSLACYPGYIISISSANYGRTNSAICADGWEWYHVSNRRCNRYQAKTQNVVLAACEGQNKCILDAKNSVFGDPCANTYKYLTVDFNCTLPQSLELA